jgi:hypothetical protein
MPYDTLAEFLVSAPLYREETFARLRAEQRPGGSFYISVPEMIDRECSTCGTTKWKFDFASSHRNVDEATLVDLRYRCKNCEKGIFTVWLLWWRDAPGLKIMVMKGGQVPKLEVTIPKEFERALGDKRPLYVKGMTLRHNNYGIGSLTYFRRLIEDTTDEMLDLLQQSMEDTQSDAAAVERLRKAREGIRFEDKVKIAGEVIPTHLRPGGVNPFGDLYDLLSIGLHDLSDEECCDIVDAMDGSLKFIYTRLKTHAQEAKVYEAAAKDINARVARLKARGQQ